MHAIHYIRAGADPENQWEDGDHSKKKQFSKPIWLSKTLFLSFLLRKNRVKNREGRRSPNSWIRQCIRAPSNKTTALYTYLMHNQSAFSVWNWNSGNFYHPVYIHIHTHHLWNLFTLDIVPKQDRMKISIFASSSELHINR